MAPDNLRNGLLLLGNLVPDLLLLDLNLPQNFRCLQVYGLQRLVLANNFESLCCLMNLFENMGLFNVVTPIVTFGWGRGQQCGQEANEQNGLG